MTRDEAYQEALEEADRNPDGSVDEKSLIDILARKLDIDEDSIRYKEAKRLINKKSRPGQTQCEGQLSLLGETPYAYEPERLVRFGDGKVVENRRSRPVAKQAEAERAQKNVQRVMNWAQRKQKESNQFSQW